MTFHPIQPGILYLVVQKATQCHRMQLQRQRWFIPCRHHLSISYSHEATQSKSNVVSRPNSEGTFFTLDPKSLLLDRIAKNSPNCPWSTWLYNPSPGCGRLFKYTLFQMFHYLFIFGFTGSPLQCAAFRAAASGATLAVVLGLPDAVASLILSTDSRACGLRQLWCPGSAAPRCAESSQAKNQTCFPCIGRQTLHHRTTSEVPKCTCTIHGSFTALQLWVAVHRLQKLQPPFFRCHI